MVNIQKPATNQEPDQLQAEAAIEVLRAWTSRATDAEIAALDPALRRLLPGVPDPAYPEFSHEYPTDFKPDDAYKRTMPDLQNGPASLIKGTNTAIQHVGISNFRLPVRFHTRGGDASGRDDVTLQASVTGTVSLDANKKGINMSRIMRSFYQHAEKRFSVGVVAAALDDYKTDLESFDARIQMRFCFPMKVDSLRSGLWGWQYYDIALELVDTGGVRRQFMHLDYVYSSTCPCSLELSEHARSGRGQMATPHSQRSVARISVEVLPGKVLWFEDLIDACRGAVPTETQVMVKREDEQAFAELNAANPIFVEDAARLYCEALEKDPRIGDFRVVASHQESLHSHDAVSVLTRGTALEAQSLDPHLFATLIHTG